MHVVTMQVANANLLLLVIYKLCGWRVTWVWRYLYRQVVGIQYYFSHAIQSPIVPLIYNFVSCTRCSKIRLQFYLLLLLITGLAYVILTLLAFAISQHSLQLVASHWMCYYYNYYVPIANRRDYLVTDLCETGTMKESWHDISASKF